jgi:lipoate-protein ligase A
VKRPTGGGAVLHDRELTYAIVGHLKSPLFGGVRETQLKIASLLKRALGLLGLNAEIAEDLEDRTFQARDGRNPACFAAASKREIVVEGRKIVGSAAVVKEGCFLQHGSILLGDTHLRLAGLLKEGGAQIEERAVSASSLLGREVSFEEMLHLFKTACSETLGRIHSAEDASSKPSWMAIIDRSQASLAGSGTRRPS